MILSRAPYRLSLGGGGTDLPSYYERFGGFILSAAIDRYLWICINRPPADRLIRVKYSAYEEVASIDDVKHDLVRPALKLHGITSSIEIASMADVPGGTGLGSSGTYLVALLAALHELTRQHVSTQELAEQASHIEIDLAGHPAGKHDHYLAAFGGLTCLDIAKDGSVTVSPLAISDSAAEELRSRILLMFTGIRRSSSSILAHQRDDTASARPEVLDSLHRTKEIGFAVRDALERGELDRFGAILHEHWENKKRRAPEITDQRIDRWYGMAREAGALGGKVVGAGGGGFLMLYCAERAKPRVRAALIAEGLTELPFDFDHAGAKVVVNI